MDLTLKKQRYDYLRMLPLTPVSCETMREHIVPDSCADIARIVDTSAQVRISGKEVGSDGRLCVTGAVDGSVIYIPEKGKGPCVLRFQLPFQCCHDSPCGTEAEYPFVTGELQSVDTRLLNPRKVLTRANLVIHAEYCRRVSCSVSVDAEEPANLELLSCSRKTRVIAAIREKEFSLTEELSLPPGRGGAEEILSCRADTRNTECRLIGTKLVLKGSTAVTALYRDSEGELQLAKGEFPFSQIMDGSGFEEDWEFETFCQMISADCRIGSESGVDDRHVLTLTVLVGSRVKVSRGEEIRFISDLYSTENSVRCDTEELELCEDHNRYTKRLNVREMLETGTAVRSVLDTEIKCGTVRIDAASQQLEIPVWARCLFLDEGDSLHSVHREFAVKYPLEHAQDLQTECRVICSSDVMTAILPDGIEVRCPLECMVEVSRGTVHVCVCGGEIEEEEVHGTKASLVLRKIAEGETLWSVAKMYRTTARAILEINELSDEQQLPHHKLLLIPRRC